MVSSRLSDKVEVRSKSLNVNGIFAKEDIKKDEELTVDYAFTDNEDYSFKCTCGSKNYRETITGFDWKIKELQDKYYDYFAQYLKDKINVEKENK